MEERNGQGVRMRDVAEAAGISRQAVYDHFGSRAELMVQTARYGDEVRGLDERLRRYRAATGGVERLEAFVEFWGNYIPEIYGIARALLAARETDEAVAAAWDDRMGVVREACRDIIERLHRDGTLAPGWAREEAADLLWTMLSIRNWEPHARARLAHQPVRSPDARDDEARLRARIRVSIAGRNIRVTQPGYR